MFRSIRTRIVAWNAIVLAMCLLIAGLLIHSEVQRAPKPVGIDHAVSHLDGVLLHLIPIALVLASAGGWVLAAVGLRPIRKMAAAASEIDANDLGRRLPVQGKDEVAELAAAFNQLLERLERSFELQQRFVADASHELRTPLTALKANTSLALSGSPELQEYAASLRNADAAADRMSRLVDELLFLSRADAGQACPRTGRDDFASVVHSAVARLEPTAVNLGIHLSCVVDKDMGACDGSLIERLISNLVGNALRHTDPTGWVTVSVDNAGGKARLSVKDSGHGISPEHLPHIFERFYRVDSDRSRAAGGAGLGLAICRSIVESLAGSISVSSEVGVGTTFEVLLPRSRCV